MAPADVAQLVERNLAKVEVAGSSPVVRSSALMGLPDLMVEQAHRLFVTLLCRVVHKKCVTDAPSAGMIRPDSLSHWG